MSGFVKQFISNPGTIGAVAPSSVYLAERMVEWIQWDHVEVVVECGPGTGAFTGHVIRSLKTDAHYMGIELNQEFCQMLQARFPDHRFYNDSVEHVESLCASEGFEQVDAIVSGLPWAVFTEEMQSANLKALIRMLRPGGQFVTFAYLQGMAIPSGKRFRNLLRNSFDHVETSPVIWRNLPPAIVYRCRKD